MQKGLSVLTQTRTNNKQDPNHHIHWKHNSSLVYRDEHGGFLIVRFSGSFRPFVLGSETVFVDEFSRFLQDVVAVLGPILHQDQKPIGLQTKPHRLHRF